MGWSKMDMPSFEITKYAVVSEELQQYMAFLGVDDTKVVHCAVDLPRIKQGPPLRKHKPKVLIATTKHVPRNDWYDTCEKLGWEKYDPPGAYPIPNLHDHYPKVEALGEETINDRPCYKVVLTPAEGRPQTLFIDKESYLVVKLNMEIESPMGVIPTESYSADYREVDGLLLAHKATVNVAGQERTTTMSSIEHNVDLPADLFDLPDEIRALVNKAAAGE